MSYRAPREVPRIHRWAGLSAVATAVLFAVANALWAFEMPEQGASGAELLDFYGDLSGRIEIGALLSLISIALFVVFAGALRGVLIELEGDELLGNIAFGGALLGLAAGIGAETINMAAALRAGDGELSGPLAQALFDISYVLGYNAAGIGIGLVALATGAAALRARALLPGWLAVVALALGLALLTPLSQYVLGPAFLLLVVLGVLLLRGSGVPTPPPAGMSAGPEYVEGRYVAERRRNPLVQTPTGGRILSAVMLPWFRVMPPKGCGVLTTTGRKTGKPRPRCVRAIRRGDKAYLVAIGGEQSRWLKNIRANPNVRLRIPGGEYRGMARELRDTAERAEAKVAYCEAINAFDYLENRAHRKGRPTREKIVELHRAWFEGGVPLVVELRDKTSGLGIRRFRR